MSLRDFNWRKGIFRLWIFLSLLWVIIAVSVFLYPARREYIEYQKRALERAHAWEVQKAIDKVKDADDLKELKNLRAHVNYKWAEDRAEEYMNKPSLPSTVSGMLDEEMKKELREELGGGSQPSSPSYHKVHEANYKVYKAMESQTGFTVSFVWYLPTPPDLTDIDYVFSDALGSGGLPAIPQDWEGQDENARRGNKPWIIGLPPVGVVFDPFETPYIQQGASGAIISSSRGPKLSEKESILASEVSRLVRLDNSGGREKLDKAIEKFDAAAAPPPSSLNPGLSARDFFVCLVVVVLMPFLVLILGLCFRWVFTGFSKKHSN